ncbi:MAG: spermidine/putrescine ABC transporter substrate-binding protein [Clostridia bacterium]|nr:spermidine/putrescine ABC transporter substrate-binding protein [Clostridia bacterium]
MKKLMALVLCMLMLVPAGIVAEEEKVVNLMTWETYVDDATIAAFEEETGIRVVYSPMDSIDSMLLRLSQNGGSEYDLILSSDYSLSILRKEGLLQKLDKEKLSNYSNLDENFLGQYYDPDDEYVIPYTAGTPLIVYDSSQVSIEIDGYEDLWDESLYDNIVMLDNPRVVIGLVLKTMGQSFNTTDADILAQAQEKMMPLYDNVRIFTDDSTYVPLVNGEVSVGFMYTPFVYLALMDRPELTVVYPKEGMGYGIDGFVIPVNAPHPTNAHILLDYLMRPDVAAHCSMQQMYICCNEAAAEYVSEDFLNNPVVYIPDEILGEAEFIEDIGEYESIYSDIYTQFKLQY